VRLNLGSLLIGWLIELELLQNKVKKIAKDEKHNILVAGPKLESLLPDDGDMPILYLPNKIPMIVPPKPYYETIIDNIDIEILGGYLLNDLEYADNIIKDSWQQATETKISKKNIIYDTVNNIYSVSYKINSQVLDFILDNYKKYNLLIDPEFIHPLMNKEKLTLSEKRELEFFNSLRNLEENIIGLALIFRDIPNFYIPVRLDFRGRLFCLPEYLTYQGIELAKSLLLFSNSEKVNKTDKDSINYLKIFGANCFGNKLDKIIKYVNKFSSILLPLFKN
jgi:DNA-directed RNA polymerase